MITFLRPSLRPLLAAVSLLQVFSVVSATTPWPGDVDLSFAPGAGIARWVFAIATQADGKVLVGGDAIAPYGTPPMLVRLKQDGSIDDTFRESGIDFISRVGSIVPLTGGKVLIGGLFFWVADDGRFRGGVTRLNPGGERDSMFEGADIGGSVFSVVEQEDGKILIGGEFVMVDGIPHPGIARLHPDGALDTSFSIPEILYQAGSPGSGPILFSLALQPDGKILIGGMFDRVGGEVRNGIARLNSDGALDETFAAGLAGAEFLEIPMASELARVHAIAIQEDGRILVGGAFTTMNSVRRNRIARLNPDGSLDHTFGEGLTGADDWVWTIALLSDGKVAIGGMFDAINGEGRRGIARLNPDGTVDKPFGHGHTGADSWVFAIAAHDDEIPIGGSFTEVNGHSLRGVARIHGGPPPSNEAPTDILLGTASIFENRPAGETIGILTAVDPTDRFPHTFTLVSGEGDDGNASFTIEGNELKVAAILDQEERDNYSIRIRATDAEGFWVEKAVSLAVVASAPDRPAPGDLDLTFGPAWPINGTVRAMARQDDGRWIVAGEFTSIAGNPRGRIARLEADGSLDSSFMAGLSGADGSIEAVAIQLDGRILIGGSFNTVNGKERRGFTRLHPDGAVDEMFELYGGRPNSIMLQADGKILVGTYGVLRLNRIGYEDLPFSYGKDSAARADGPTLAMAVQSDGKILIGGGFSTVGGEPRRGIARLNADGGLDGEFAADIVDHVVAMALQDNGQVLVSGRLFLANGEIAYGLARLHPDGAVDDTFYYGIPDVSQSIQSIALQDDGKILIAGTFISIDSHLPAIYVSRLNPDGTQDESFNAASTGPDGAVHSLTLQSDGGIMIGGEFEHVNGIPRSRVARLHGGSLPPQNIHLNRQAVRQYLSAGTTVGTLSATDLNAGQTHVFALVPGAGDEGNESFIIEGYTLKTATVFDADLQAVYSVRIRSVNTKGLWVKRLFTVTIEEDHYRAWAEQLPESQRGEQDDPGGFGIANFLRYALDLDAAQPDREGLPRLGQREINTEFTLPAGHLSLAHTRRTDDPTLIYIVEGSPDLLHWQPLPEATEINDNQEGTSETVTVIDPEPMRNHQKRFLRLRVER